MDRDFCLVNGHAYICKVVKSYPKLDIPEDIRGEDELKAWWEKQWNQERDVLHQARFYRVGKLLHYCFDILR